MLDRLPRNPGAGFTLVSEEAGVLDVNGGGTIRVVVDPIDGSVNAKRGIPFFSVSVAVADGPTMGDVFFGYVYDFGADEEWTAVRGEGAFLNGERLGRIQPKGEIEILSFEATLTSLIADRRRPWSASRSGCGSWARSRSRSATSPPAASTRLLAEGGARRRHRRGAAPRAGAGIPIGLAGGPDFLDAPLDLEGRSRVVAAGTPELCEQLAAALMT